MKKYILIIFSIIALWLFCDTAYYRLGWYIDFNPNAEVTAFTKTDDGTICIQDADGNLTSLQIRGVTVTAAEPGEPATNFATDKKTYLSWFSQIAEMGANTLRVPYIMSEDFYRAFYEYNTSHDEPLYLVQGISIDSAVMDSTYDIFDEHFYENFRKSCIAAVDVIHGTRKLFRNELPSAGYGSFTQDVSPWVLGYVLGSEWDPETVAYANHTYANDPECNTFQGQYLVTREDAAPVEAMLAYVADSMISYEAKRYKVQRVFGFYSTVDTDPLLIDVSDSENTDLTLKAPIDTERILCTDAVLSGQFAAYAIFPHSTDRLFEANDEVWESLGVSRADYDLGNGQYNFYAAYLQCLQNHHTMPILIIEFGASSSRAPSKLEWGSGKHFGSMTEQEQGEAIVSSWHDIIATGCVGGILSSWQDDWGRTASSRGEVDAEASIYWSDAQAAVQGLGLLTFDPEAACRLDGDISEWTKKDLAATGENGSAVYIKYDERYIYFMVKKTGFDLSEDTLYIPIDTTQLSGSNYCANMNVKFDRAADFLLVINGRENSRLLVQERYDFYHSGTEHAYYEQNMPALDSSNFGPWYLPLGPYTQVVAGAYETGKLRYGSTDPTSPEYSTLADFIAGVDCVEIRLPWQLLHFSNPSKMEIHGDYYEDFVITSHSINRLYVGIGDGNTSSRIAMDDFRLRAWKGNVTYQERLKDSYYIVQACWRAEE